MRLDKAVLQQLVVRIDAMDYVRILDRAHEDTPLGMGYGRTRFSSPNDVFRLLYLAQDSRTAIAERIVRDRFQGKAKRELLASELRSYSIAAITNADPLALLDLRHEGANLLGLPTDVVRARAQSAGCGFSQELHDRTSLDGIVYMSRITNRECVAVYERAVTTKLSAEAPALPLVRLATMITDLRALGVTIIADIDAP